jgi:hypothetical protein
MAASWPQRWVAAGASRGETKRASRLSNAPWLFYVKDLPFFPEKAIRSDFVA